MIVAHTEAQHMEWLRVDVLHVSTGWLASGFLACLSRLSYPFDASRFCSSIERISTWLLIFIHYTYILAIHIASMLVLDRSTFSSPSSDILKVVFLG